MKNYLVAYCLLAANEVFAGTKYAEKFNALQSEYQFKIDITKINNLRSADLVDKIVEFINNQKQLIAKNEQRDSIVYTKILYNFPKEQGDPRIGIRVRFERKEESEIVVKYNTPVLNEIFSIPINAKIKHKLEQDIYDLYTKFALTYEINMKGLPSLNRVRDVKSFFPDVAILNNLDEETPLFSEESYILRIENIVVAKNDLQRQAAVRVVLDLQVPSLDIARDKEARQFLGGEISFKIKNIDEEKTKVAILLFQALSNADFTDKNYLYRTPGYYYN